MIKHLILLFFIPFFSLKAGQIDTIRPVLDLYERPMTILSIGENDLLYEIIAAYPATCILAGTNEIQNLSDGQVVHLKKAFSLSDLKDLNKREHFDVILGVHSLHKMENWKECLNELFKLGDNLVIETVSMDSHEAREDPALFGIARYLTNLGLTIALQEEGEDPFLWYCFKPKSTHSYLYEKQAQKGISLTTYQKHQGNTPSLEWIGEEKKKLPIWKRLVKTNLRVDGKKVY